MAIFFIFISGGLFLGWLLGKRDSVNAFGSSVNMKMLNFRIAAVIASIFVVLGAVFQGQGTSSNLQQLANIANPYEGFIITVCAAILVLVSIKIKFPISTSQTIVGAVVGYSFFFSNALNWYLISSFVLAWILAPVLGMILGGCIFIAIRWFLKRSRIHIVELDYYLKIALIISISLAAFGLGANNIGNVIGVFTSFAPNLLIDFGFFSIDGLQLLFLIGGISIGFGVFSYSKRAINDASDSNLFLTPETTIVILLAQALVLFLFSSAALRGLLTAIGLPALPLVPVSSTQIIVGALFGIGLVKGIREIENRTLIGIGANWILTPIVASILSYAAFFSLNKLFDSSAIGQSNIQSNIDLKKLENAVSASYSFIIPGIILLIICVIFLVLYMLVKQQRIRYKVEKDILIKQNQLFYSEKALNDLELKTIAMENEMLSLKLKSKRKEFIDIAININEQHIFLEKLEKEINEVIKISDHTERTIKLKEVSLILKHKMNFSQEKKELYMQIEDIHKDFHMKLKTSFPELTALDTRLAGLLRLNLSTKEISSLLNISTKSVEMARYRLKKKLKMDKEKQLLSFINNI